MSKREAMRAALERRPPTGAVPIWEVEFQAWDAASGRHLVLGREFEALTPAEQTRTLHRNAEILLDVAAEMHFAALGGPNAYWNHAPGQLAYYVLPGDMRFRQLTVLRDLAPPDLLLTGCSGGVMGADYSPEFCYRLFDDPDGMDRYAEDVLRGGIECAKRLRDCGAEAVVTASDIADNAGPFFNPAQMRRWILPYLARWSEAVHAMGLYAILHTDGNIAPCLDALADTGLDAVQGIDPVAGMDMRTALDTVRGRVGLCGNVDCGLLVLGRPDQVFESTRRLLTDCRGRGALVLGCSNAVQPDVPIANYRAMIEAWRMYGATAPSAVEPEREER